MAVARWTLSLIILRLPHIGLETTRLQYTVTVVAMNLERVYDWIEEIPLAQTRSFHFEKMAHRNLEIA